MPTHLRIRTPESIEFTLPLATPLSRALAWLLDALAITAATTLVGSAALALSPISFELAASLFVLASFLLSTAYAMTLEWLCNGQTLGKRLLRLRVIDRTGLRLTLPQVILRNLLRPADSLPSLYALGGVIALLTPLGQRLGDLAAGTVVIRLPPPAPQPDTTALATNSKFNSLRAHPHLATLLRNRLQPQQTDLLLRATLRRDQLEPAARATLFTTLANALRPLAPFPEESTATLTDEQYVRNTLELLLDQK